jgi:hypothetical protein
MEPQIEKANEVAPMVEEAAAAATAAAAPKESTESPSGLLIGKNVSMGQSNNETIVPILIDRCLYLYIVGHTLWPWRSYKPTLWQQKVP